ncbi:hypothetical protein Achl_4450 (plasmid) [Pseudarthrobacter chlorophenolicus A6]|uniref:Transcriptional regulator, TetR family n=1 Tax=Pseudarthrobacter chlorophenolicus (strain ATCC 700700 / DSM 12829 / CIP 107037 / JCM 12360 / KCTC 9906 / NCIMB 13794 / A6) TaxID=452863 RepID=B8HJ04_PSECP|nr:hypothetical protein [Pseudarthrobacter chlorophenolicus]ACL42401.1 hypothetical protein Achl_4450 [Pseudarthrobacter chlorophenolicus A6]SDQ17629.1 hypothetical protein SAMN04489738_0507 [Pseudarthrobacter chlorophenolicus]
MTSQPGKPFRCVDHSSEQTDLSGIVTNLKRVRAQSRMKLANDSLTRAFLDAALSLTEDLFSAPSVAGDEEVRPTMSYLSKPKVLSRAQQDHAHLVPTEAKFRDRWAAHQHFLADFIAYALTARHWSLQIALADRSAELLTSGADFSKAVHEVAYEDLKLVLDLPAYRFQLLAVASSAADSVASDALSSMYSTLSDAWCQLYVRVFDHYGVRFRKGVSIEMFNIILQSTAEGLGMRLLAGVDEPILNHEEKSSLLGTAALALMLAFLDAGDDLTLEELAERALSQFQQTTSA